MSEQKAIQQKAIQLEMHREQAKQVQQQILQLQSQLQEFENIRGSLKSLGKEKEGTGALMPFGAGIFLSGKLGDTSKVVVSAGAGVMVEKTLPEAEKFLDDKSKIIKNAIAELGEEMQKISASAQAISKEMQRLSETH